MVRTWLARLFVGVGIACLGYVAYILIDARVFAWVQNRRFDEAVARQGRRPVTATAGAVPVAPRGAAPPAPRPAAETDRLDAFRSGAPTTPPPAEGTVLGRIEIPRLGVSSLLLEGIAASTLYHGAGHIPNTALPGSAGNVGIAAHRDSFFRGLKDIQQDDLIEVTTLAGSAAYRVAWTRIVEPDDVEVLDATPDAELTLVTCYPFYYVGAAPRRFIVRAHRVEETFPSPTAAGARPAR